MDFADPKQRTAFFAIHSDLPREGPGNADCSKRALGLVESLPSRARVLDVGCGPGAQTIELARLLPAAHIVALDAHPPFLRELERRAVEAGVAHRVEAVRGDMAAMPFPDASFDLIWCEGAAYVMGTDRALLAWRRFLKPGGQLALTEPVWLTADPPARVRACWAEYPAMRDTEGCRALVGDAGYRLLGDFVLPPEAWWAYYAPMAARLERLRHDASGDAVAEAVMAEAAEEIAVYRDYSDCYSYIFLVAAA